MFELAKQSWQPHIPHMSNLDAIGKGLERAQHPGLQILADKMQARLENAKGEIDRDIFERFCERVLPATLLNWQRNF